MAGSSAELRTSVKLETKSAVKSLQALEDRINRINRLVNNSEGSTNKIGKHLSNATSQMKKLNSATQSGARSANQLAKGYQKSSSAVSTLTKNLRTMISTYVGVMGAKAVLNTSDTITSAQNQLNNLKGGNAKLTQDTLNKTYAASQRSRGDYLTMLSNVGKTMTLAGDSFQNNVDNAIRFQEIMSKAYTVGGSSAAEQASSMYQLVQALGSGILQGDELRSLREGAPIAYKKIEEFAQGVLNTTDSLKKLASEGVITSDIVVAAIMNAEEEINASFNNTVTTFAQALNKIKNSAIKAFEPVLQRLNDALNSDTGQAIVNGICNALVVLANVVLWLFDILGAFFKWFANNWYWLQWIVYAVILCLIIYFGILVAKAIWAGITAFFSFLMGLSPLYLWILVIGLVIGAIVYLANTVSSAVDFMVGVLFVLAVAALTLGIILNATWLIWVAIALAVLGVILAVFMKWGQQIMGGIYVVGAWFKNVGLSTANFFIACWNWIATASGNSINWICNVALGLWNSIKAIGQNIGIAFENGWIHAQNAFWTFISAVLKGIQWLEPAINAVAKAFGKEGVDISGTIANIEGKKQATKSYVSVGNAWAKGYSTNEMKSLGDAWNSGMNTFDTWQSGWASNAYSAGALNGAEWQDAINSFGSSMKDKVAGLGNFNLNDFASGLGKKFGVSGSSGGLGDAINNLLGGGSGLPDPNDPKYGLGKSYNPSGVQDDIDDALKKLNGIDDNTGSMADAMELADEDLEYLRKLAEKEWKKEFTTAEIKVDMSNYNTISGEGDLDGIVTKLRDKLYEELDAIADGVYA